MVEILWFMTLYSLRWEVNIAFFRARLLSHASFAIQASKHGSIFLNETFVHSKEITPNPEYSTQLAFWKLSAKAFGLKIFSRDDSQGIKTDGKHGGFVDRMRP